MCFTCYRARLIGACYRHVLKPIFFLQDPERVHDRALLFGRVLGSNPITRTMTRAVFGYKHQLLEQTIDGISFSNPVGLAAGFDKNAVLTKIIPCVGFGFEEVGSITALPCAGNKKPRLWRLKKQKSLQVNYGLANEGADSIYARLASRAGGKDTSAAGLIPLGINIAKTNCKETAHTTDAIADYALTYLRFKNIGSYDTINISCPNAHGGQPFTSPANLDKLLFALRRLPSKKPMYLKLSPDLTDHELDAIILLAEKYKVAGFICTNLTKDDAKKHHGLGAGGMSGQLVKDLSDRQISYIYQKTTKTGKENVGKKQETFTIIGVGGIANADDAYRKLQLGASLVQLITGMIYEGPQVISEINAGVAHRLAEEGKTLASVRGTLVYRD